MPLPEISADHLRFVEEYVKDRNGTRAALAAGLSQTYQGARQSASDLLTKPDIKRWVRHLLVRQAKALKFKPSKVLRNWMLASTADLTYFEVGADGKLGTAPGVPKEYLRAVRKMKQTRTEKLGRDGNDLVVEVKTEIELRDPFGPECKLMEHYGELAGEDKGAGDASALMGQLAALLVARQPQPPGGGGDAGAVAAGAAVGAPEHVASPGVPQSGG